MNSMLSKFRIFWGKNCFSLKGLLDVCQLVGCLDLGAERMVVSLIVETCSNCK